MALNPKRSDTAANAANDAVAALLNTGYIRIYDSTGAGQPATCDTAVTSQVLLAELRFGSTAFASSVAGVATANVITADSSANATGTPTWFRCLKSDGTTAIYDGSAGTSLTDMILGATTLTSGQNVPMASLLLTEIE